MTELKHCDECKQSYYNDGWHAENCTAPIIYADPPRTVTIPETALTGRPPTPAGVCGKRTVRNGYRALCVMEAGHKGACT